jgi:hypothetical protein
MVEVMDEKPSRSEKYFAWILISLVSFFFAEVISGSSMIRSFEPGSLATTLVWSLVITIPLYGLHTIILATVIYRFSKPRLYTLFLAGVIFALYEAYITKVLWAGWGSDTVWYVGGIAVVETTILLLFWHPFMAFILPLFASESLLTRSRDILAGLPGPLRRLFSSRKRTYTVLLLFALICGINQAGVSPSPIYSIASDLLAFVIFTPLLYMYRRKGLQKYDIRQLLPGRREFVVLLLWLLSIYLVFGLGIKPETLRNLLPQLIVWLLYAVFLLLLYLSLKKSKGMNLPSASFPIRFSWRLYGAFFLIITFVSALISLVPFRVIITLIGLFVGTFTGLILLALSVRDLWKK